VLEAFFNISSWLDKQQPVATDRSPDSKEWDPTTRTLKNGGNFGNSFVHPIFFNFIYIKKSSNNKDFFRKLGDLDKSSSFQND